MPRVKLPLPSNFIFTTETCLRVGDINYGGHLGNDSVLSLVHEARVRFLRSYGWSELDVAGVGTIMTDAIIVYKSEAFLGDRIQIRIAVDDFNKYGCDFYYLLENKTSGREVARAKTGLAFFDYRSRKLVLVPQDFANAFVTTIAEEAS
jgi:acyl-CoA thioesterase FadM